MISAKNLSFLAVVIQQTCLVLVIRYSKTRSHDTEDDATATATTSIPYLTSVVVFSAELYKLILNGGLEIITSRSIESDTKDDLNRARARTRHWYWKRNRTLPASQTNSNNNRENVVSILKRLFDIFNKESQKLVIPAILYVIQNNLLFFALSNLSVPIYQITNQGKLLTTAIISRIMLQKQITNMQYFAILFLGLGVAVVHMSEYKANSGNKQNENEQHGTQWLGLLAVFVSCITSGFAGVYFELILKTTQQSVYCRNVHLALFSLLLASFHILYTDSNKIAENGMFQGFDKLVVLIVVMQGMTGFVVSMMFKYADAVLKGFATSIAVVVATVASFFLFDTSLNAMFVLGASMVASAVKIYSYYGKNASSSSNNAAENKNSYSCCWKYLKNSFGGKHLAVFFMIFVSILFTAMNNFIFYTRYMDMILQLPTVLFPPEQHPTDSFPPCTPEDQHRDRPEDIKESHYEKVRKAEEIFAYIVTELHKFGAPVTLLFGTALHEYRNGTGNCVQPYFKEDDFDIGVFSQHFHYVVLLIDKVEEKFGWKVHYEGKRKDTFLYFSPPKQKLKGGFQVDVYALKVDKPREGLMDFDWDGIRIEKHALLPLVKHKPVVSSNETTAAADGSVPFYYMPYNPHCYLTNLYGETYMTPQRGKKLKRSRTIKGNNYNSPPCGRELSGPDAVELQRQMSFLNKTYELQSEADLIWDIKRKLNQ
mmetsp:Transcript_25080/g.28086  ORF Transcript_25080/g.28086 Transcript_25080/m.28086 type:complete len:710 (-) Transcript_25080:158-2287(-)